MNEVTLKIIGTQESQEGENNEIEIITRGKHYKKADCFYLVYDETELSGMEGSTTTLKIEGNMIYMKRFGKNQSRLVFEKGVNHKSIYQTDYGNMDMEVYTEKLDVKMDIKGIKGIDISYRLSISGDIEMKNTLSIVACH